ncbi:HAD hydrolase-like protein [Variovorax sp. OV700]|jgi:phosphoglycolate phosphatase|uniref:HAD family hydrolase n=1 Tax=Variovorax sp. OV700 TaxID=1882826 RepID=UPI0008919D57|nr:HAD hydrolase-like protein [Variovorax sp. OV700]SDH81460.1 phosphoglycolate phosphatase [Variovorax sp. OV700]
MIAFQAIAFDLDGTLVDSVGGVALALNTALYEADLPCFDLRRVRGWIGDGPDILIERALRAIDLQDVDTAWLSARLRRNFDAMTLGLPFAECSIYAGVEKLLEQLGQRNVPLAVVTNTPTVLARAVLEEAGLLGHFTTVRGADTTALRMPSPLSIEQAARELGTRPEHMLMIGDSASACQAACTAGCRAAWAGWGYGLLGSEQRDSVWRLDTPADLLVRMALPRPHPHSRRPAA